jgi:DnaJ-class molecular chaperone
MTDRITTEELDQPRPVARECSICNGNGGERDGNDWIICSSCQGAGYLIFAEHQPRPPGAAEESKEGGAR